MFVLFFQLRSRSCTTIAAAQTFVFPSNACPEAPPRPFIRSSLGQGANDNIVAVHVQSENRLLSKVKAINACDIERRKRARTIKRTVNNRERSDRCREPVTKRDAWRNWTFISPSSYLPLFSAPFISSYSRSFPRVLQVIPSHVSARGQIKDKLTSTGNFRGLFVEMTCFRWKTV